jgi:hypothetical protein
MEAQTKAELITWAEDQTAEELVNTYNRIPGVKQIGGKPANAFKSREEAAERIWNALHPAPKAAKAPKTAEETHGPALAAALVAAALKPAAKRAPRAAAKGKVAPKVKGKARKPAKRARAAKGGKRVAANGTSKKDQLLALISRKQGATLPELMKALGWQKHSVRGAIATLGHEHTIHSEKIADVRTYRVK